MRTNLLYSSFLDDIGLIRISTHTIRFKRTIGTKVEKFVKTSAAKRMKPEFMKITNIGTPNDFNIADLILYHQLSNNIR
jgi:hypothetical protein